MDISGMIFIILGTWMYQFFFLFSLTQRTTTSIDYVSTFFLFDYRKKIYSSLILSREWYFDKKYTRRVISYICKGKNTFSSWQMGVYVDKCELQRYILYIYIYICVFYIHVYIKYIIAYRGVTLFVDSQFRVRVMK